jgi:alpha-amylase
MNWSTADAAVLAHWQKLGQFRARHAALSRGVHHKLSGEPYVFSRVWGTDRVVVAPKASGEVSIPVTGVFSDGEIVHDAYSGIDLKVTGGVVKLVAKNSVLLEVIN